MGEFKPCPFCGGGETTIEPGHTMWTGTRYSDPITWSVYHWCGGDKFSVRLERRGKTREDAITAWNKRA